MLSDVPSIAQRAVTLELLQREFYSLTLFHGLLARRFYLPCNPRNLVLR